MFIQAVRRSLLSCCLIWFGAAAHAQVKIVALGDSAFVSRAGPTRRAFPINSKPR